MLMTKDLKQKRTVMVLCITVYLPAWVIDRLHKAKERRRLHSLNVSEEEIEYLLHEV